MRPIEFGIPFRPVSLQTADRQNLQAWKAYVAAMAAMVWQGPPASRGALHVTIVFLCDERAPIDVDNVIKPIQDALSGLVYEDDVLVFDTESHRRYLQQPIDVTDCPSLLIKMIAAGLEAVYVRVRNSRGLGEHL